jgi:hypothetical protein
MHALQRFDDVRYQRSKPGIKRRAARDQDVVKVGPGVIRQYAADGCLEAAPDTVALDSAPDLLAHRKPEPRGVRQRRRVASLALENKCRGRPASAVAHALELAPALQGRKQWPCLHIGPRLVGRLGAGLLCGYGWRVGHAPRRPCLRPTGACAPWPGGVPECGGPREFPCACEIHGGACGPAGSVDRCASRLLSRVEALRLHALGNRPESRHAGAPRWCGVAAVARQNCEAAYMGRARLSQSAANRKLRQDKRPAPGAGAGLQTRQATSYAAGTCFGASAALLAPTAMVRGFSRSGTLRTSSI